MSDLQDQLADLRKRIVRIDRKYQERPPAEPAPPRAERCGIEEWMSGQEITTPAGKHFETERLYERHRRHGQMEISCFEDLPEDLLGEISEGGVPPAPAPQWAFLDTETTGLAGGSGTYAFLIGVGRITSRGFAIRQFFMRDYDEEPSLLHALAEHLAGFTTLVTYNGKAYDLPLLETRYRMTRARPPFERLAHLDLLFGARRLWRLRLESCRLVDLENQILGVEREGDLPGEMIPYVYFEYLRRREAFHLQPIFHHNAVDILTLACLTAIVPWAFREPEQARLTHGAELVALARWLRQADRLEQALVLFRQAVGLDLSDELLFRTQWDIALLEKKRGQPEAALALFAELAGVRNPHRVQALEELAKHYEHRERNYVMALEFTETAISLEDNEPLRHRRERLLRLAKPPRSRRLL